MFNPEIKLAKSKGVDLPIMYIYLAGYMSGNKLYETTVWRKGIRDHYRNYEPIYEDIFEIKSNSEKLIGQKIKGYYSFPFAFLDPYNGKEFKTISADGVKSHIPPTAIRKADKMSVTKANVIIANLNTFGEQRPMIGTHHEICWAAEADKPIILICEEKDLELYKNHPFTCDCDYYLTDYTQVYEEKILETYYRRIAGSIYE